MKECEPNLKAALRYRLKALILSWYSSSNWLHHDAYMADTEEERGSCLKQGQAYEVCAGNVQRLIDELGLMKPEPAPKPDSRESEL